MSNINCGCLQFLKRDSIVSREFQLKRDQTYTIGTCPQNDIRLKVQTVVPEYTVIKTKHNGLVEFLSNSVTQCKINDKPFRGSRYLDPGDVIFILGKKFRYENVFYSKGDIKTMQKLERSLCNGQILKSNITNRRHTVVVKRNVITTPVSLKGLMTPAPKHSRNFFLEEDIENQPVTPSRNNSISVYTLQTRQVFNTPQSIGTNKEGKDLSFLQQINFNFGDNPSSSRSFVINKEDSESASASIDEDAPDHSPINSFTLNIGDFPNNTLIEDVTDPGLVINDDVGNSSGRAKLKVLGEISPNDWSTGEGNRRSGRKSSALKMNRSELIASTPSNVRVSRKKSVFIPFRKTLHFEHLTNRSTPKSIVQQSSANVSFASCGAKTSRRSILKKKIDSSVLSNSRSRRSIRTSRDNTARKSITTRSSKSMIESIAMQNQKGPNNQATKSLTLNDSDVSHSFVYSLPIFQKNEFVTQRKSSKNTSTSKNQTNLLDNDCAKIAIGSCSASGSDYDEDVVDMADIDNTHTSDVVLKSPSGYLDFASSSEATDILEFSNHENSLDETMFEPNIRPDRKPLGKNCVVKRTRRESKSLDISSRESKKFKRAKSDMDRIRRSIFNVNKSDLSEEADDEEQEAIELRNASEESSEIPPADDSSILVDSEDAPESTQTCKTPKNDSRAVRTSRSTLLQTSKAQESPENCSNAVRRSKTVEQSLQNNSRYLRSSTKLSKTPTIEEGDIVDLKRNNNFNVNRSDISEETDEEEEEAKLQNASDETSSTIPSDDSSILEGTSEFLDLSSSGTNLKSNNTLDVSEVSGQARKTAKKYAIAAGSDTSALLQTSKSEEFSGNDSKTAKRVSKLLKTPTVKQSLQHEARGVRRSIELLKTPAGNESPKIDSKAVRSSSTLLKTPTAKQSLQYDTRRSSSKLFKTPSVEESPRIDSRSVRSSSKLLKTPRVIQSPQHDARGVRSSSKLLETPTGKESPKIDSKAIKSSSKLLKTPRVEESLKIDSKAVRSSSTLLKTPTVKQSPQYDTRRSGNKLLKTPSVEESPKIDSRPVRNSNKPLKTPTVEESPKIDSRAVRSNSKLLNTPTVKQSPQYDTRRSSSKLLKTPSLEEFPKIDSRAVRSSSKLLNTVTVKHSPRYDVRRSSNKLHKTPSVEESPKINPRPVRSSSKLLKTATSEESPKIYSNIARSSSRLFKTPTVEESDNIYDVTRSDFSEEADTEEQAIDLLNASEDTSDAPPLNDSSILGCIEEFLDLSPKGEHFKSDDSLNVPEKVEERTLTHKTPEDNSKAVRSNRSPLLQTSKAEESPGNNSNAVKGVRNSSKHLKTPTVEQSPQHNTRGVRSSCKLLKTPSVEESPRINSRKSEETPGNNSKAVTGVRSSSKYLKTPTVEQSPQHDTRGIRSSSKLLKTPSVAESPKIDSPKAEETPGNNSKAVTGVRSSSKHLKTPTVEQSPQHDTRGVRSSRKLPKTPSVEESPKIDPRPVRSSSKLLKTPTSEESPKIYSNIARSSSRLFKTPTVEESDNIYDVTRSDFSEEADTEEQAIDLLNASEDTSDAPPLNDSSILRGIEEFLDLSPKGEHFKSDDSLNVPEKVEERTLTHKTPEDNSKAVRSNRSPLLQTSKAEESPGNNSNAVKGVRNSSKHLKTPIVEQSPQHNTRGVRSSCKLLKTPSVEESPRIDSPKSEKTPGNNSKAVTGVRSSSKHLKTPTVEQSPQHDTRGIRSSSKLLKTPSVAESSKIDSPKAEETPGNTSKAVTGVRSSSEHLKTPTVEQSPQHDTRGVRSSRKLPKTPSVEESPKIDPRPVRSSSKLLKTPTSEESPKIYSNIARSSSRLFKTPTVEESDNIYDVTRSVFSEEADTEEQAIDLLNASEDTSDAPPLNDSSILGGIEEFLDLSPKGEHFKSDDSLNVPEKVEERTLTHKTPEDNSKAVRSNRSPLLQTSKAEESPGNNSNAVKGVRNSSKHLKTPTVEQSPQHNTRGVRSSCKLLKTPSVEESPRIDSPKSEKTPGNNSKAVTGVRSSSKHLKTPTVEQSPQHDTRGVRSNRKLPKTPSVEESPKIDSKAIRSSSTLLKTPTTEHSQSDARSVRSSNTLFKTPSVDESPKIDSKSVRSTSKLLKTPTIQQSPQYNARNSNKLLKTPSGEESPKIDSTAVRISSTLLKTPTIKQSPQYDTRRSCSKLLKTPSVEKSPKIDSESVRSSSKLLKTPTVEQSPQYDAKSVRSSNKLLKTSRVEQSPQYDSRSGRGSNKLLKTPTVEQYSQNVSRAVRSRGKLLKTPAVKEFFEIDSRAVRSSSKLLKTPSVEESPKNYLKATRISSNFSKGANEEAVELLNASERISSTPPLNSTILQTSKAAESYGNNSNAVRSSKLLTPTVEQSSQNDPRVVRSNRKLLETPIVAESQRDSRAVRSSRKLLGTPAVAESPQSDLRVVRSSSELLKTPTVEDSLSSKAVINYGLLKTPKVEESAKNNSKTPKLEASENYSKPVRRSSKLLKTLTSGESPLSRAVRSYGLLKTPKVEGSPLNSLGSPVYTENFFGTLKVNENAISNYEDVEELPTRRGVKRSSEHDIRGSVKNSRKLSNTSKIIDSRDDLTDASDDEGNLLETQKFEKSPSKHKRKSGKIATGTPKIESFENEPLTNVEEFEDISNKIPRRQKSPKNDLTDVTGVRWLMKTPKRPELPLNDLSDVRGLKKIMATPKVQKLPHNDLSDLRGVKNLLGSQKKQKEPRNDLRDIASVKKMFSTPKLQNPPKNDLTNVRGVKELLKTPKLQKLPRNDLTDIRGVKKMFSTPKFQNPPKNDLSDVKGVKGLLKTPKVQKLPRNDLSDVSGVNEMFSTPKPPNIGGVRSLDHKGENDTTDNRDPFDILTNRKPIRTYKSKSPISNVQMKIHGVEEDTPATVVDWVKDQNKLLNDEVNEKPATPKVQTRSTRQTRRNKAEGIKADPDDNSLHIQKLLRPTRQTRRNKDETLSHHVGSVELREDIEGPDAHSTSDIQNVPRPIRQTRKNKETALDMSFQSQTGEITASSSQGIIDEQSSHTPNIRARPLRLIPKNKGTALVKSNQVEPVKIAASSSDEIKDEQSSHTPNIRTRPIRQTRKNKGTTLEKSNQVEAVAITASSSDEIKDEQNNHTPNIRERPLRQTRKNKGRALKKSNQVEAVEIAASSEEIKGEQNNHTPNILARPIRQILKNKGTTLEKSNQVEAVEIAASSSEEIKGEQNNHTPNIRTRPLRQTRKNKELEKTNQVEAFEINQEIKTEPNNNSTTNIQEPPKRQTRRNKTETSNLNQKGSNQDEINDKTSNVNNDVGDLVEETKKRTRRGIKSSNNEKQDTQSSVKAKCEEDGTASTKKRVRQRSRPRKNKIEEGSNDVNKEEEQENVHTKNSYAVKTQSPIRTEVVKIEKDEQILSPPRRGKRKAARKLPPQADTPIKTDGEKIDDDLIVITDSRQTRRNTKNANLGPRQKATNHNDVEKSIEEKTLNSGESRRSGTKRKQSAMRTDDEVHDEMLSLRRGRGKGKLEKETASSSETPDLAEIRRSKRTRMK